VGALAADAYLTALAAEQTLKAAQAQLERAGAVGEIVRALAKAELRPGADVSRIEAEAATAETQVVQARNAIALARNTLRQLTGKEIVPASGGLLQLPPDLPLQANVEDSPYAREQAAAVAELESQRDVLNKSWSPRFNVMASSYARGTGANPDGTTEGGVSGLGPNIHNWALGLAVTFPAFDFAALRARKEINEHRRLAEAARHSQVITDLNARLQAAREQLATARHVAALVPKQLEAARAAEQQARARYKAGLGTLIEVADAQRLLTQTEIDNALATLNVWRSLLAVSTADGDLNPFLNQVN
jgi:outer membrane protein TolC